MMVGTAGLVGLAVRREGSQDIRRLGSHLMACFRVLGV